MSSVTVKHYLLLGVASLLLAACGSTTVKTTHITPLEYSDANVAESELLDVGIIIFDPGIEALLEEEYVVTLPEIRKAEARYIPYMLSETVQQNGSWGAVRVIPSEASAVDVYLTGKIVHSDGEKLVLSVRVFDSSGRQWYMREYKEVTSKYNYDDQKRGESDPFQGLYNRVANDMLVFRERLPQRQKQRIRTISELKFARDFSKEAFAEYLVRDEAGHYDIERLPPENDPLLQRVRQIRERDYLYIDTLQDYYSSFALEMDAPYREWRKLTYDEVIAVRELRRSARNRMIAGAAAVIAGVAAAGSSDGSVRQAGTVGVIGGAYTIKTALDKRQESQIHVEALQELSDSLEAEVQPQNIELEDRSVTLTGTVENQYDQWRGILQDIYTAETGDIGNAQRPD